MTQLPTVTDHALLRWLERVERIDLVALRDEIARAARIGIGFGASSVVIGGGKLVIRDGVVVTVLRRDAFRKDMFGTIVRMCPATSFRPARRGGAGGDERP